MRNPNQKKRNKGLLLVPGVGGDCKSFLIQSTAHAALEQGFHVFVTNPLAPPDSGTENDLEVIDYSQHFPLTQAIQTMRDQFGEDCEIYALGYSLGSNHLLRHLGAHPNCKETCRVKAAVSISGAFDLPTTGIELQYSAFGLYDNYILNGIRSHFNDKKFLV